MIPTKLQLSVTILMHTCRRLDAMLPSVLKLEHLARLPRIDIHGFR
jgi:hypothetical protein